jgi:ComF family protein
MPLISHDDYTVRILHDRFRLESAIDAFQSCYYFEEGNALQKLIHMFKYEEMTIVGRILGHQLGDRIGIQPWSGDIAGLIPVPLHNAKQRERGYNQSECICKGISEKLQIPVTSKFVRRKKNTVTQTHLNAEERRMNVKHAFFVEEKYRYAVVGKNFVIVDDVITTGSTIQEVARVLKKAGAEHVYAASVGLAKLEENQKEELLQL